MAPPATGRDELDREIDVTKEMTEVAAAEVIVEEVEALLVDHDDEVEPLDSKLEILKMLECVATAVCWTGSPTARVV
jgi:hypothetical protein